LSKVFEEITSSTYAHEYLYHDKNRIRELMIYQYFLIKKLGEREILMTYMGDNWFINVIHFDLIELFATTERNLPS
jgi:hypothetical protein